VRSGRLAPATLERIDASLVVGDLRHRRGEVLEDEPHIAVNALDERAKTAPCSSKRLDCVVVGGHRFLNDPTIVITRVECRA
jgi:hypothetical protein